MRNIKVALYPPLYMHTYIYIYTHKHTHTSNRKQGDFQAKEQGTLAKSVHGG